MSELPINVQAAWEEAHDAFCPTGAFCSIHLMPGDRWLLSRVAQAAIARMTHPHDDQAPGRGAEKEQG